MLSAGGLCSATLSGNAQLAYENTIPLFFKVDEGEASMTIPLADGPSRKSYPKKMQALCIDLRAAQILDRIDKGVAQFIFSFGANAKDACDKVISIATANPVKYQTSQVMLSCRAIREWETGALSVFGLMLRNRFGEAEPNSIGPNVDLVGDAYYDGLERDMVSADRQSPNQSLRFIFTLISSTAHQDRCIVLLSSDHMAHATDVPYQTDIGIGVKLDLALTFAQEIFFARHVSGLYPRPDWRFSKRKVASILRDKKFTNSIDAGLTLKEISMVQEVQRLLKLQGRRFRPEALYGSLASLHSDLTVEADDNGTLMDPDDCLEVILAASINRKSKVSRIRSSSVASSVASSSSSLPQSTTSIPTTSGEPYPVVCECGQKGTGNDYAGLSMPVIREAIVSASKTAKHKPTDTKKVGDSCLMGIPAGDRWWAQRALVCLYRGKKPKEQKEVDPEITKRILAAYDKYVAK